MTEQDRDAKNGAGEAAATPLDGRSVDLVQGAPPAKAPLKLGGFGGLTMITDAPASPSTGGPAIVSGPARRTDTKLLIVGSGPAGLTAAIYAARGRLEPIVLAGSAAGGQLMLTSDVENYPGFPEGIQGPDLMAAMRNQAERFGSRIIDVDIDHVDFSARPFRIWARGIEYHAEAVIVATGASALWLDLESETRLRG